MRAIAKSQPTFGWLHLVLLLVMGSLLYFYPGFAWADGKLGTVPTKLVPLPEKKVEAPPPVKTVVSRPLPPLPPTPKEERCYLLKEETVTHAPAQVTALSDMAVRNCCCGGLTVVPGVYSYLQPPPTVTWTYKTVCQ